MNYFLFFLIFLYFLLSGRVLCYGLGCYAGSCFAGLEFCITFAPGEMAEWSIAAVLKTVELRGSGGSNPSLSAKEDFPQIQKH